MAKQNQITCLFRIGNGDDGLVGENVGSAGRVSFFGSWQRWWCHSGSFLLNSFLTSNSALYESREYETVLLIRNCLQIHTTQNGQNNWTKILTLEITIFGLKMMVKSGLEFFILKSYVPLQSCCCPVQKNLPRKAELAWQVSRYL